MATVLVVDDDFDDLKTIKEALEKEKHTVTAVTNGAQALDSLKCGSFELILLDIKMPTLSGYDLLRLLRERVNGNVKMVFVSIVPKQDVDIGSVDGFIQKPVNPSELSKLMKDLLG